LLDSFYVYIRFFNFAACSKYQMSGMNVELLNKEPEHLHRTTVLPQTTYWAKVKNEQGYQPYAFKLLMQENHSLSRKHNDDLLVVVRHIGKSYTMAYVPYGPVVQPQEESQGKFLEELSESLRHFLSENCMLIRYDLLWQSPWQDDESCYTDDHIWLGPPEPRVQEMRMNFDTVNWNLRKAPTDILPANTLFLDLNNDEELLLQQMKSKTRYNIGLARRRGVEVYDISFDNLPVWYQMYKDTACRNGLHLHDITYFESILQTQADKFCPSVNVHLLMAVKDHRPLAGMMLVLSAERATYLYGASSSENRNLMGTYALQWEAIRLAQKAGCSEYDMFGISPSPDPSHPMYGLYRFKKGFGGNEFFRQGCWDYPLNEHVYEVYRSIELNGPGYYS
jgi:lipid II:glycine glycyltransferase (peptidoglycan interpeptide bridge formation enzyme)